MQLVCTLGKCIYIMFVVTQRESLVGPSFLPSIDLTKEWVIYVDEEGTLMFYSLVSSHSNFSLPRQHKWVIFTYYQTQWLYENIIYSSYMASENLLKLIIKRNVVRHDRRVLIKRIILN